MQRSPRTLSRQLMRAWTLWQTNITTGPNTRMLEELALHTPMTFHTTSEQDLNPRPCSVIDHPSVLVHEMMPIDPGEKSTHLLTWKPTVLHHSYPASFLRSFLPHTSVGDLVLSKSRCSHTSFTRKSTMSLSSI
jgi:hypothetical protein